MTLDQARAAHPTVYALSRKYSPPRINLRDANILDDYGDETYSQYPIAHQVPEDVTRQDLDEYWTVWPFMGFEDLLFYLFAVAREYEIDHSLDCMDYFLYSLDRRLTEYVNFTRSEDLSALSDGLKWMWNAHPTGYADWGQCPELQKVLGVSPCSEDQLDPENSAQFKAAFTPLPLTPLPQGGEGIQL